MAECNSFITTDFVFPRPPANRPALAALDYRIATYPEFVEILHRSINTAVELRAWTHRTADDPGIALLEGAAIVGDILTFYQERYANEAFLRTARWRESVANLTRLLGHRLAPGVGGRATLAFEVRGTAPIEIPEGLPVKADLQDIPDPADFQTVQALTAYPGLSRFHLYRQRLYGSVLPYASSSFEVKSVGGSNATATVDALDLKKGDRVMLAPPPPSWITAGNGVPTTQKSPQVVKVKAVTRRLGRTIVELEAALADSWTLPATAYRLGRAFRHFGHSAPPRITETTKGANGKIDGATDRATLYLRHVRANHSCVNTESSLSLPGEMIPLDQEVNDLTVGSRVVVQTLVQASGSTRALASVKVITQSRTASISFGPQSGPSTLLTLDSALTHSGNTSAETDVRDYQVHEVTSPPIQLQPVAHFPTSQVTSGPTVLYFYGRLTEVKALAGRRVMLQAPTGESVELRATSTAASFALPAGAADEPRMWPVTFDKPPKPFTISQFDESQPTIDVFANVVDAMQGKQEHDVALGNGDARARFQTFKLPKAPLTYHLSAGATPPQVPLLEVFVSGRRWQRVDSLFGHGPDEQIYIVREDADGASYVQFGDGEAGARLLSGVKNVVARFRTGNGAHGPVKKGATPSAGKRVDGLDKLQLAGVVSGGAEPETADKARQAAPGKIQSLGRLVSLRDFETEALTIPGVTTAAAEWGLRDGVPTLTLRVLLESGREAEFDAVRTTLQSYQRCRGPDRFPMHVEQAFPRYVFLDLVYAFAPRLQQPDVEQAIRSALGVDGDGLFAQSRRRLGAKEYATRIEGVVQGVDGVTWCKVNALGMFAAHVTSPALPATPRSFAAQVVPAPGEVLQLQPTHLTLTAAPPPAASECA